MTQNTTLFAYAPGFDTASYTDTTFVPIFLDEVNATTRAAAEAACGGGDDIGCVFDYIATGNQALAVGTKDVIEQVETSKAVAGRWRCCWWWWCWWWGEGEEGVGGW